MKELIMLTKKRFIKSPMSSLFIVIQLSIGIFMISTLGSYVGEINEQVKFKIRNNPPNSEMISLEFGEEVKFDKVLDELKLENDDTGIIFNNLIANFSEAGIDQYVQLFGEEYNQGREWTYPLISGRYYTLEEVKEGKKVVLVGKGLLEYIGDKEKSITIDEEEYEVIGVVGDSQANSMWDGCIFMPARAFPKVVKEELSTGSMFMVIYSDSNKTISEINFMISNLKNKWKNINSQSFGSANVENAKELIDSSDLLFTIAILGYIITILIVINIVKYWFRKQRREIGIRKALGHNNVEITKFIIKEIGGIIIVSTIVTLVVQFAFSCFSKYVLGYSIKIYAINFIIAIITVVISTLITAIIPIREAIRVSPIEIIRSK